MPERVLEREIYQREKKGTAEQIAKGLLKFELIWENQVGIAQEVGICRDNLFIDIEMTLISHDGVED